MVSKLEVLARWAYSEITDGVAPQQYDGQVYGLDDLRAARTAGTSFNDLTHTQRYSLAWGCFNVRPALMAYLVSVGEFNAAELIRADLGNLWIPPNVWGEQSGGKFVRFSHYITTQTPEPRDARNVVCDPATYQLPAEPVTVGYFYDLPVLIDGFHRAAAFWRCGPAGGSLPTYMPQNPPVGAAPADLINEGGSATNS
jgi:hypothetical protein